MAQVELPDSVIAVHVHFDGVSARQEPKWDFLWDVIGDEIREKTFLGESLSEGVKLPLETDELEDQDALTEATIKVSMIIPDRCFSTLHQSLYIR